MKKINTLLLLLVMCGLTSLYAQTEEPKTTETTTQQPVDSIGKMLNNLFGNRYNESTTVTSTEKERGREGEVIVERFDGSTVNIIFGKKQKKQKKQRNFYRTASIEQGYNKVDDENLFSGKSTDNGTTFPRLNSNKSVSFALYPILVHSNLLKHRLWFVTGLGFEWFNFRFNPNNSLALVNDKITQVSSYEAFGLHPDSRMKKSKLTASYLNIPLMVELSIPTNRRDFRLAVGANVGVNLASHTKVKYKNEKDKTRKDKNDDDMYLSSFRYGFRAQVSYGMIGFFANYYMTPLFKNNRGPQVYPFVIGTTLLLY